jgi:hypothetical protein
MIAFKRVVVLLTNQPAPILACAVQSEWMHEDDIALFPCHLEEAVIRRLQDLFHEFHVEAIPDFRASGRHLRRHAIGVIVLYPKSASGFTLV